MTPQLAAEVFGAPGPGAARTADPLASLSPRQRQVLQLVAEWRSAKEIAAELEIAPRTAEFHKLQLMQGLGLHSTADLTRFANKHGLVAL